MTGAAGSSARRQTGGGRQRRGWTRRRGRWRSWTRWRGWYHGTVARAAARLDAVARLVPRRWHWRQGPAGTSGGLPTIPELFPTSGDYRLVRRTIARHAVWRRQRVRD